MTIVHDRYVVAPTLSEAWLDAVRLLHGTRGGKAVHLLVRITQPPAEISTIRAAAQDLIDTWNAGRTKQMPHIETTRNTIFPASWAQRHPEPADLAAYYQERYVALRRHSRDNARGTYFGRIVAYPRDAAETDCGDQLADTVRKVRAELSGRRPKSSRYEVNIYSEQHDTSPMSFPCLAHLSFHVHDGQLHQQAVYRNEVLVGRAYGNYLGLAELQQYVAQACDLQVGELLMTINHVELDGRRGDITRMLADLYQA